MIIPINGLGSATQMLPYDVFARSAEWMLW